MTLLPWVVAAVLIFGGVDDGEGEMDDVAVFDEQWTLDLAFEGLRLGLKMAAEEKGDRAEFAQGRALVDEAYAAYRDGNVRDGFFKLEELQNVLKKVPSQ